MADLPSLSPSQASSSRVRMKIDVTSDVNCPFCLIGMKQLLQAIEKFRERHPSSPLDAFVRLLPFELTPGLTDEPLSRQAVREKKFGKERAVAISAMVDEKLRAVGVKPKNPESALTSSSHLAHRLQTYALIHHPSVQLDLATDIFLAYHQDGRASSDRDMLSTLAVKHGIFVNTQAAQEFLRGKECDAEVKRAYATAHRLGVTGVPFFVFQDRYAASGAMGVDEFVHLFEEIIRREEQSSATPSPSSTAPSPQSTLSGLIKDGSGNVAGARTSRYAESVADSEATCVE